MVLDTSKLFSGSWKTTVGGLVVAVFIGLSSYLSDGHTLNYKDPLLWAAVGVAVKGFFEKDGNVTGGTTPNPNNSPAAVVATTQSANPFVPKVKP